MKLLEAVRQRWPNSDECSCSWCVSACEYHPGRFLPDEIQPAAEYLGLSVQEFFTNYLVLDYWTDRGDVIGVLSPGRTDEYGAIASFQFAYSSAPCIFLKDGRCSIHPVKPHECRSSHHSLDQERREGHGAAVAGVWEKNEEGRAIIRELGYDPDQIDIPEADFGDLLTSRLYRR